MSKAVILYSTGSPQALDVQCIREFLKRFLSDKNVIKLPSFLWQPILYSFILPRRPQRLLQRYSQIFQHGQNPYLKTMEELATKLQASFGPTTEDIGDVIVKIAYAYIEPSFDQALQECLKHDNVDSVVILPLFPQYSFTTTKVIEEQTKQAAAQHPHIFFSIQPSFCSEELYINAIVESIRPYLFTADKPHLLLSFHSLPVSYIKAGDPYLAHCTETATNIAKALNLSEQDYTLSYHSRFGPATWLKPESETVIHDLLHRGYRHLVVATPGFSLDCLETLYDIDLCLRESFMNQGGSSFSFVPGLNAGPQQIELLHKICLKFFSAK